MASVVATAEQDMVIVTSESGERIDLASARDDLIQSYSLFEESTEGIVLPFPSEMIREWDMMQSQRRMDLYGQVADLVEYLQVKTIRIYPYEYQVRWISRMTEMLDRYRMAVDTTPLSGGKTFMQIHVAQNRGMEVLVICPAGIKGVWKSMTPCVTSLTVISYGSLGSKRAKTGDGTTVLKHGLLTRTDSTTVVRNREGHMDEHYHVDFAATTALRELCARGIMVIIDEVQNIKNKSCQNAACVAVVDAVRSSSSSIVTLLSGSPFDKKEHAVNLMRTLGFIRHPNLLRVLPGRDRQIRYYGLQEMIDSSSKLNDMLTRTVIRQSGGMPTNKKEADSMVWNLYLRIVKPLMTGGTCRPPILHKMTLTNTLFVLSDEDATRYIFALGELKAALRFDESTGVILGCEHTTMMAALTNMEGACCNRIGAEAITVLNNNGMAQVIIFCTFMHTYDALTKIITAKGFEVGILNGTVPINKRDNVISRFQSGELRVLLVGVAVGGAGLNLHDRLGGRPRHSFIFPSFNAINMYQATGRTYRPGTKSDATCEFVYCAQMEAVKIINAIHEKSGIIRNTLSNEESEKIILPGEYPYITR